MPPPRAPTVAHSQAPTAVAETATAEPVAQLSAADARYLALAREAGVSAHALSGAFATAEWGGRFAVDGVLGKGSQGVTFVGTDKATGLRVALKLFDVGTAANWKAVELFEREAATLRTLDDAQFPALLDVIVDEVSGARAIVRTLVAGDSLHDVVVRDGPLNEAALWTVLRDTARALAVLHGHASPIIHRDIKPQNLIRRSDGTTCVVDFGGVGRLRDSAGSTVVGTFGYMAPEQLYGAQTPATDVYALGATLLRLASGKEPEELPRAGLAIDVNQSAPWLSPPLRGLLSQMVAPDPAARPADGRALLDALTRIETNGAAAPDSVAVTPTGSDLADDNALPLLHVLGLVLGIFGSVATVAIGEVLIPLILTVIAAFAGPEQRARMQALRSEVRVSARALRRQMRRQVVTSASHLERIQAAEQARARGDTAQLTRRARRELEKVRRREMKARLKEELRNIDVQRRRLRDVARGLRPPDPPHRF